MDKLDAKSPCAGLLPLSIGTLNVSEMDVGVITSVSPFDGASNSALGQVMGLPFPAPGRTTGDDTLRCVWVGQGEALLMGMRPDTNLGAYAALVDQSDAWAIVRLQGEGADDALARLVPVDMRLRAFAVGATARTQLGHMNASVTRIGEDAFMIAVFRSMAKTLVHDLRTALEAVAARG
ncbi:sarcosine oxidase subunit gamma [Sulfitobacter sp.]|uniref:sarcosine oxidase subunit gamma n=1 Tax=Sulfitobacter sp. TaxID=1903071 RepID=UPI003001F0B3